MENGFSLAEFFSPSTVLVFISMGKVLFLNGVPSYRGKRATLGFPRVDSDLILETAVVLIRSLSYLGFQSDVQCSKIPGTRVKSMFQRKPDITYPLLSSSPV